MHTIPIKQTWTTLKTTLGGLMAGIALTMISAQAMSQTTLYEQDFTNGLGNFSDTGRVYTGSYGVRLRGGAQSQITSSAIDVAGADDLSITYNRNTSGLDTGETATASYSFDGVNFTSLESVGSANGQVSFNLPNAGNNLYLRFALDASSFFETYTLTTVVVETQTEQPDDPTDPDDPEPPMACEGGGLQPGLSTRSLAINGVTREYILNVPQSYNGEDPTPLLLDFHPLLNDADFQLNNSGMRQLSEQENFIVAFPDGIDNAWNFGPCCTESRQVDDLQFAREVIEDISNNACVDENRIYASGYSNGGGMSYHLACNAADVIAAVAPAAFDLVEEVNCNPSRPISVYSKRGRFDFIVPYSGGESTPPTSYNLDPIHFLGAEETFEEWGDINNCPSTTTNIGNSCEAYRNCGGDTEVVLCTERFGSHSGWDADAAWEFLQTQTLPE